VQRPSANAVVGVQLQAPELEVTPEQTTTPESFLTVTVENGSAEPEMVGRLLAETELFRGALITGADGGFAFTVKVTAFDAGPVLFARSVALAVIT